MPQLVVHARGIAGDPVGTVDLIAELHLDDGTTIGKENAMPTRNPTAAVTQIEAAH
jgi:hypothetical protein